MGYTDAFGYLQVFYGGEDRAFQESSSKAFSTSKFRHLGLGYCAYGPQGILWLISRLSQSKS